MSAATQLTPDNAKALAFQYRPIALRSDHKRGLAIVQNGKVLEKVLPDIPSGYEIVIAHADQIRAPADTHVLGHMNYLFDHLHSRSEVLLFDEGDELWLNAVRNALAEAGAQEVRLPPKPDMSLLYDDATPPEFDPSALSKFWADWCKDYADSQACPIDYVAANLLASSSAWIGNARRVSPNTSWVEPPHLWCALVGDPSYGKTPSQTVFAEICKILERKEDLSFLDILNKYNTDSEAAKAAQELWQQAVKKAVKDGTTPPMRPTCAVMPSAPIPPRIMVQEATSQELQNLLAGNPKGLLTLRDELSGWMGGFDRYSGAGADRAFYLEAYNGGAYSIDLVKNDKKPIRIPYTSVAILGGFQPDKLREAVSGADDGLPSRFIYVYPRPTPYRKLRCEGRELTEGRKNALENAARRLRQLSMHQNVDGSFAPRIIPLNDSALIIFEKIREESINLARSSKGLAAGWHGKTPSRALRLALTIEYLAWAANPTMSEPKEVSATSMACAGTYLDYLGAMFDRVMGGFITSHAESDASDIAHFIIKTKSSTINERKLYQTRGFSHLREAKRRREAFDVLDRLGWLISTERDSRGRPRGDWNVSALVCTGGT